jgi:GT2 family glycosyltransferase
VDDRGISVIIPNFNGKDLLKKNLPSVYLALSTSGIDNFEVIIADDASSDDSIIFLKTYYPDIIIVKNTINRGFSSNTNSGIAKASKELLFILNNDVELTANYFSPLLRYFDSEDAFGVMGKIISMTGEIIQDTAKYPSYKFGRIKPTLNYEKSDGKECYSMFLSGANALINRNKMESIGNFNSLLDPYYYEDVDLGITAWRAGFKLYYESRAVCKHPNSATISKSPKSHIRRIVLRNKHILHYLHLSNFEFFFYIFRQILKAVAKWIFSLNIIYLLSLAEFCTKLKKINELKNERKKILKYSTREVMRQIRKSI